MQTRSGRVARYENALSTLPSEIVLSGDGDIPVTFIFENDAPAFARGGLVRTADKIKRAGRYGDTEIIHVNKDELEELKQLWGEPTINPQTGCPEYFLKKFFKKIIKPLAKIAPIAAMFIPGIGPLAAAAIGAASGGITGGLKGAVLGGVTGGLGAAGASGAPSILGKTISSVAPSLSPVAQRAVAGGLTGALGSAARGDNILNGALTGGALGAAIGPGGLINRGPTTITGAPAPPGSMPPGTMSYNPNNIVVTNPQSFPGGQVSTNPLGIAPIDTSQLRVDLPQVQQPWLNRPFLGISDKVPNKFGVPVAGALALSALSGKKKTPSNVNANMSVQEIADKRFQPTFRAKLPDVTGMYANPGARQVDYGTIDEQYRYGQRPERSYFDYVPQAYAKGGKVRREMTDAEAQIAVDILKRDQKDLARSSDYLYGPVQKDGSQLEVRNGPKPTKLEAMAFVDAWRRQRAEGSNYLLPTEMAKIGYAAEREGRRLKDTMPDLVTSKAARLKKRAGGEVDGPMAAKPDARSPFAVRGKGTGRSDEIEALLSDGEYVMDAETVALLGDGSNEAGAKRLDEMRVSLRKHKGKNLAKGKFSVNAKRPEAYMAGGRV